MAQHQGSAPDEEMEQRVGALLQYGVLLAAAVVLAGGVLYLIRHGKERPHEQVFRGEQTELRNPAGIATDAASLSSRGIIQLGLLLLIATPVARVFFSAILFFRQRDHLYVVLTLIVLSVLVFSFCYGLVHF